ncbi:MAG TPA: hypothetical protein VML19_19540 [Verrucomicrobiae bacterium]|nr:hypothetical protein [Verrucomicrobiae bacterium]
MSGHKSGSMELDITMEAASGIFERSDEPALFLFGVVMAATVFLWILTRSRSRGAEVAR